MYISCFTGVFPQQPSTKILISPIPDSERWPMDLALQANKVSPSKVPVHNDLLRPRRNASEHLASDISLIGWTVRWADHVTGFGTWLVCW